MVNFLRQLWCWCSQKRPYYGFKSFILVAHEIFNEIISVRREKLACKREPAWDPSFQPAGVRLTPKAWELAGIPYHKLTSPGWEKYKAIIKLIHVNFTRKVCKLVNEGKLNAVVNFKQANATYLCRPGCEFLSAALLALSETKEKGITSLKPKEFK